MNPIADDSLFRRLIEQAPMAVVVVDSAGRLVYTNQALLAMLGYTAEELLGHPIEMLLPGRLHQAHEGHRNHFLNQPERRPMGKGRDLLARTKAGNEIRVEIGLYPVQQDQGLLVAAVVVDITDRLRQQQINERHDRLESVGFLAGGLAHDYNNVLAGILGNIDLLARTTDLDEKARDRIGGIRKLVNRGSQIARRLITFSKGGAPVTAVHDLIPLVREAAETAVSGTSVALHWLLPAGPLKARVDPGQIGQVVTNLVINAVQALEGQGTLRISAERLELAAGHPIFEVGAGRYVLWEVQDQGQGIPPDILAKVFEPFFTSKPRGTGLGLAIVHSIVEQHGGAMAVRSEVGMGTTFSVLLPTAEEDPLFETPPEVPVPDLSCSDPGRILVMDDNVELRATVVRALEDCGFEVQACGHGEEALDWILTGRRESRPFGAAVLDVVVPGRWGGLEVLQALEARNLRVPVLLISGYTEVDLERTLAPGGHRFLSKPFALAALVAEVERLLGRARKETPP